MHDEKKRKKTFLRPPFVSRFELDVSPFSLGWISACYAGYYYARCLLYNLNEKLQLLLADLHKRD